MANILIAIFFLQLISSVSSQILLLYCTPVQKYFRTKYNGYGPHFYLIFCTCVIQANQGAYNYLKMPQKNYSNILNKCMAAVSYNSKNKKCQHFKLGLSNMSSYITSLSHLLGNLSPDYLGEKSSPSNTSSIPLSTLSMPWRSSDIIES